jgi:hypothetical protein
VFIQIYHIRAKHARSFVLYRTALRAKIYHIRAKHARIFVLYRTALMARVQHAASLVCAAL